MLLNMLNGGGGGVSGSELNGVPVIPKKSKLRKRLCAFPESLFANGFATFAKKRRLKSCDHAQQPAAPPSLSRDECGYYSKATEYVDLSIIVPATFCTSWWALG